MVMVMVMVIGQDNRPRRFLISFVQVVLFSLKTILIAF